MRHGPELLPVFDAWHQRFEARLIKPEDVKAKATRVSVGRAHEASCEDFLYSFKAGLRPVCADCGPVRPVLASLRSGRFSHSPHTSPRADRP